MENRKSPKLANAEHLLKLLEVVDGLRKQIIKIDKDISYIKTWIEKHEEDELKLKKSGWFY
jgi:3-methyladenine DNA glycosylase AlkD